MKKVNCICLHDNFKRIVNITVTTSDGENVTLLVNKVKSTETKVRPFSELYKSVLDILKNNNFYVSKRELFGRTIYGIQFINIQYPYVVENYGYTGETED